MLCEKYKDAVIEAAVSGAELGPVVRTHIEACTSCTVEFDQQRSLVDAIDANLHQRMNVPVPAAMLQRLEAHIAVKPEAKRALVFRPIFIGAFGTLTVAAIVFSFLAHTRVQSTGSSAKAVAVSSVHNLTANQTQVRKSPSIPLAAAAEDRRQGTPSHRRERVGNPVNTAMRREPEILVPPEERIAMERFIADLHGTGEIALARAKRVIEQREQAIVPVDAPELQIVALKVSPIRDTDVTSDR